jgi:serine/threonine protein kinase
MKAPRTAPDLVALLRTSGVLEPQRLEAYLSGLRQSGRVPCQPEALAALLVRDGLLTRYQAELLLRGNAGGLVLGKYRILDKLGDGGTGTVYLAQHMRMNRRVALKVLPPERAANEAYLARFRREAEAAAALDHPNIVQAYDFELEGGAPFLVMEYVEGPSLQEVVERGGPLEVAQAAHYVRQAALGLQHAHEAGLVHRDVQPANLLVSGSGVVKVLDLGLARFARDEAGVLTRTLEQGMVLGTADYLAPEQARDSHDVDIRADVYSLGATFYFLLTGQPPFPGGTLNQKLLWHQTRAPRPVTALRPEVPQGLAAIVARMLAKDVRERYQTPAEVAWALAPWALALVAPAPLAGVPPSSPTPPPALATTKNPDLALPASLAPDAETITPLPAAIVSPKADLGAGPAGAVEEGARKGRPKQRDLYWAGVIDAAREDAERSALAPQRRAGKHGWYVAALVALVGLVGVVAGGLWWALSPPAPAPAPARAVVVRPPTRLRATPRAAGGIELRWEAPAGQETAFRVERAGKEDAADWAELATTAPGATRYTDATAQRGKPYYYRVFATSEAGTSASSDTAWLAPDYADGFTEHGLVRNGGATLVGSALRLTDNGKDQARSAFYHLPVRVHAFRTRFRFRIDRTARADGFTFCLQATGPNAVGLRGGGLGYQTIGRSLAIKFDLWDNSGEGPNSTGLYTDGSPPEGVGAINLTPSGIDLHSGRLYDVEVAYARGSLSLTIRDVADPAKTFRKTFAVNVPRVVRGPKAFAGFTASTGGEGAIQDVLSWTWEEDAGR